MKVAQLIEALKSMPSDATIVVTKPAGGQYHQDFYALSTSWVDPFGNVRIQVADGTREEKFGVWIHESKQ